jgi:hypothetical protein
LPAGLNGSPIARASGAIGSDGPAPKKVNTVLQHKLMQPDSYREASENFWMDLAHSEQKI